MSRPVPVTVPGTPPGASRPAPLIVVVAYASDALLPGCLAGLSGCGQVLVVDNSSSPATADLLARLGLDYLDPGANLGFGAGVNAGLARFWDGRSDVLLVNPDALVGPADVAGLLDHLHADPRLAAVGPVLTDADGRRQPADWPMPTPAQVWLDAGGLGRRHRGRRFVTGAVLALRGSALAAVGGFDERFFLYAEEADWQLRAQRAGWRVAVCPTVTVAHVGAASSSDPAARERLFLASAALFAAKWYGPAGAALMRLGSIAAAVRRWAVGPNRATAARTVRTLVRRRSAAGRGAEHVVQVVRSDAFAGVERYIVDVAGELHRRGWRVSVVGGDPVRMRRSLPAAVAFRPARTVAGVARALLGTDRAAVVHAHMTAAELPAALVKGRLGARLVVTRHFAGPRGSTRAGRISRRMITPRVDEQLAVSGFVAAALDEPALILRNGVPDGPPVSAPARTAARTVTVLQRLEPEKDTAVALAAWGRSGLAAQGWRLEIHGHGSQDADLRARAAGDPTIAFRGFTDTPLPVFAGAGIVLATAPAEPFGLAVAEAMSTGAPVVAARGGAHEELLGADGVYFTPGDADDCARALAELAADVHRVDRGRRLRDRQRELFSLTAHVDALERLYRGAGGRGGPAVRFPRPGAGTGVPTGPGGDPVVTAGPAGGSVVTARPGGDPVGAGPGGPR